MDSRQLQIVLRLQDQATKELQKLSGDLNNVARGGDKASSAFGGFGRQIAQVAAAYVSFRSIYSAFNLGVRIAADMQTAEVGLTTLLGDAEAAGKTIERLKKEAARTPFELPGLTQATQLLTSVTKDGDKSIDILLDVGEALAAMGKGQAELDRIIVNLQQIAATGRAATIDIRQFAFAGIPIYEMLSEATGKYGEDLEELISSGGVTFDLLVDMFDKANDSGGRFFGAFENQSGTFNQALSNMKDSFSIFMSEVVQKTGLFDGLTDAMVGVSDTLTRWGEGLDNVNQKTLDLGWNVDWFSKLTETADSVLLNIGETILERVWPEIEKLIESLKEAQPLFQAMGEVFGGFIVQSLRLAMKAAEGWILIFTEVFVLATRVATFFSDVFGGAVKELAYQFEKLGNFVDKVVSGLKEAINLAKEIGGGAIDYISSILPGRASGGPVSGGQAYMVGERGPEMFVPRVSGSIIPNHALAGAGGVNISVYGDVTGEELVAKVKKSLEQEIKSRIRV